jgi:hypothetical protein
MARRFSSEATGERIWRSGTELGWAAKIASTALRDYDSLAWPLWREAGCG